LAKFFTLFNGFHRPLWSNLHDRVIHGIDHIATVPRFFEHFHNSFEFVLLAVFDGETRTMEASKFLY
jgi:hypothetical protein